MAAAGDLTLETAAGPGRLFVVLGPSGSGKDTLMGFARREFSRCGDVLFVRRAITRPADPESENHIAMSDAEFDATIGENRFSLTWSANGLRYGLPRDIEPHLAAGKTAVVNGSRGAWDVIRKVFPVATAVEITVDPIILSQRLQSRGRETASEIAARLKRAEALKSGFVADVVIDNSGSVEMAGLALVAYMRQTIAATAGS